MAGMGNIFSKDKEKDVQQEDFEEINYDPSENYDGECNPEDDELFVILDEIQAHDQLVEQMIRNQIEKKDGMIDKLHKELEFYKQGEADRFADQLMKEMIKIRKDMARIILSEKWEDMTFEDIQREYEYIYEDLTDLLERQGIDPYQTEPGEAFSASIHQAKIEKTEDPSLDKKIKESLEEGYRKGDKILQPEKVVVYQYNKN